MNEPSFESDLDGFVQRSTDLVSFDMHQRSKTGKEAETTGHHLSIPELQREIETAFETSFRGQIADEIRLTALLQQLDQTKIEISRLTSQQAAEIRAQADQVWQQKMSAQRIEYETKIEALEKLLAAAEDQYHQKHQEREEELAMTHSRRLEAVYAENEQNLAALRSEFDAATAATRRELESRYVARKIDEREV